MQRKPSKKTRGTNAKEKRLMAWVKEQPCIQCGGYPVVVDHCYGSTFKHNKELIGMVALLPLCQSCDSIKTLGSHRGYLEFFGETQAQSFLRLMERCPKDLKPTDQQIEAIKDWNR